MVNVQVKPEPEELDTSFFVHDDMCHSKIPFSVTLGDDDIKGEVSDEVVGILEFGDAPDSDDIGRPQKKTPCCSS